MPKELIKCQCMINTRPPCQEVATAEDFLCDRCREIHCNGAVQLPTGSPWQHVRLSDDLILPQGAVIKPNPGETVTWAEE